MKQIGKLKIKPSCDIEDSYVSIGFECLDRDLWKPEKCYDLLGKSGVKHARCQTGWSKCEKEKGVYDFAWLDDVVDNLLSRGIKPWFNVGSGNPIYMQNDLPNPTGVGCVPLLYGEETYQAWKNYIRALALHYKGRVTHYEIWNEPDNPHHWYPEKPNPLKYIQLVKDTRAIIKEVNPDAKVGADIAGLSRLWYTKAFAENLGPGVIDFFCIHIYSTVPEGMPVRRLREIKRLFRENGLGDVDIWQGEAGYPSWAYEGHWLIPKGTDSERSQAVWQLRRYFLDVAYGLKRSSFFQMADMWEKQYEQAVLVIQKAAAQGILNGKTYTPKKSYETISYLSSLLTKDVEPADLYAAIDFWADDVCEFVSTQIFTYRKNGYPMCAYYLPTDVAEESTKNYSAALEMFEKIEEPVLVDMYTGDVYEISYAEKEKTDIATDYAVNEFNNFRFAGLPIKDYPLVITDRRAIDIV